MYFVTNTTNPYDAPWVVRGVNFNSLEELLIRAIPDGECDRLREEYRMYDWKDTSKPVHPTQGNIYPGVGNEIATYNNTREGPEEIIAWLYRALELTL